LISLIENRSATHPWLEVSGYGKTWKGQQPKVAMRPLHVRHETFDSAKGAGHLEQKRIR
jgi:hypothetical protein